jgi:hypothetical protein
MRSIKLLEDNGFAIKIDRFKDDMDNAPLKGIGVPATHYRFEFKQVNDKGISLIDFLQDNGFVVAITDAITESQIKKARGWKKRVFGGTLHGRVWIEFWSIEYDTIKLIYAIDETDKMRITVDVDCYEECEPTDARLIRTAH